MGFLRFFNEPYHFLGHICSGSFSAQILSQHLTFQPDALEELAEMAFRINEGVENIGARRLQTVMSKLLNEILFDIPDTIGAHAQIVVDKQLVQDKLGDLVKDKDLSRYIL